MANTRTSFVTFVAIFLLTAGPSARAGDALPGPVANPEIDEVLAGAAEAPSPDSFVSELTRHRTWGFDDIWWNNADGSSLGVIHRDSWKQWVRYHFEYFDAQGVQQAEGVQPKMSFGMVLKNLAELEVRNAAGEALVSLHGTLWTTSRYKFRAKGPDGAVVADVYLDKKLQSLVVTQPGKPRMRLASMIREQQASDGYDRWRLTVKNPSPIDRQGWGVLAAFCIGLQRSN